MKEELKLGGYAKDTITGFKGTVTGTAYYLHGVTEWLIQPVELHEGLLIDSEWIEEGRLEALSYTLQSSGGDA